MTSPGSFVTSAGVPPSLDTLMSPPRNSPNTIRPSSPQLMPVGHARGGGIGQINITGPPSLGLFHAPFRPERDPPPVRREHGRLGADGARQFSRGGRVRGSVKTADVSAASYEDDASAVPGDGECGAAAAASELGTLSIRSAGWTPIEGPRGLRPGADANLAANQPIAAPITRTPRAHAAAAVIHTPRLRAGLASGADLLTCAIQRSSSARSWAESQRSSGCFPRHFVTTCSSAGGVSGCKVESAAGSACIIAPMRLDLALRRERARARHHLVEDRAQRPQVRPRVGFLALQLLPAPCTCGVPMRTFTVTGAAAVGADAPAASAGRSPCAASFARPKSRSFATVTPDRPAPPVVSVASGLRSRWMIPCSARGIERVGHLRAGFQRLPERQRAARKAGCKRLAGEVLKYQVVDRLFAGRLW